MAWALTPASRPCSPMARTATTHLGRGACPRRQAAGRDQGARGSHQPRATDNEEMLWAKIWVVQHPKAVDATRVRRRHGSGPSEHGLT